MTAPAELRFEAPGPGEWFRDRGHFPEPVTRLYAALFPPAFARGTSVSSAAYGSPSRRGLCAFVHGLCYFGDEPVGAHDVDERIAVCDRAYRERLWRQELARWDREVKPGAIRRHLAFEATDLAKSPNESLARHVRRCLAHFDAMVTQHHTFNASATVPLLVFLARAVEWSGQGANEVLASLRGCSPVSDGGDELTEAVAAVRADATATAVVTRAQHVDDLRRLQGWAGAAVETYVRHAGGRLAHGFDFVNPTAGEVPGLLLRALQRALGADEVDGSRDVGADLRQEVPPTERAEFDELYSDARATWRLRDERGVYSDAWAAGLLRRAVLEAGRRLADCGRIEDPVDLFETSPDELAALLSGHGEPGRDDLAARARARTARPVIEGPEKLIGEAVAPVDLARWPARFRAVREVQPLLSPPTAPRSEERGARGIGAYPAVGEGRVRVVVEGPELADLEDGEILVVGATSEAIGIVVPLLGGIVTDHGGLLSHAAIVAREVGIPGVVGCGDATSRLRTGDYVRVDGLSGEVVVLERSAG